jgi:hypothetical protein
MARLRHLTLIMHATSRKDGKLGSVLLIALLAEFS